MSALQSAASDSQHDERDDGENAGDIVDKTLDKSRLIMIADEAFTLRLVVDIAYAEACARYEVPLDVAPLVDVAFCWRLTSASGSGRWWILPFICVHRNFEGLLSSLKDGRFGEQMYRMARTPWWNARRAFMVEKPKVRHSAKDYQLVNDCLAGLRVDGWLVNIFATWPRAVCELLCWYRRLFPRVKNSVVKNSDNEERSIAILQKMGCHPLENVAGRLVSARELFGIRLVAIPGVTVEIAMAITKQFSTMRCLYDAWDAMGSDEERMSMISRRVGDFVLSAGVGDDLAIVCRTRKELVRRGLSAKIWNDFARAKRLCDSSVLFNRLCDSSI
jgi:ERCC4-type nuclease